MIERCIEVGADPLRFRRLTWDETQAVLDELAGAPADTGAKMLRHLASEDGGRWESIRVVYVNSETGDVDAGVWLDIASMCRFAEWRDPDRDAFADAFDTRARDLQLDELEREESDRRHEQAHSAGRLG